MKFSPGSIALLGIVGTIAEVLETGSPIKALSPTIFYPEPTTPPVLRALPHKALLAKRSTSDNICGYYNGSESDPFDCGAYYCGFNAHSANFGCCVTGYISAGQGYVDDCFFPTSCLNYDTTCDAACQNNTALAACTSSQYPYCVQLTYASGNESFWDCWATKPAQASPVNVIATYTDGPPSIAGGVLTSSSIQSPSSSSTSTTSAVQTTTSSLGLGGIVPQQSTVASTTTTPNPSSFFPSQSSQAHVASTTSTSIAPTSSAGSAMALPANHRSVLLLGGFIGLGWLAAS